MMTLEKRAAAFTKRYSARASRQGWGIFHSDTYGFEIERDDQRGRFASDDQALGFVMGRASMGCPMAKAALAIHLAEEKLRQDNALKVCEECGDLRSNCTGDEETYGEEE
jgi:hypothetical protein